MKTKIISIALAVVTMLSAVALFSGCSDGEYPVNIPKGYYIIRIGETVRKVVIR